ncbi:MAG TPA: glutathione peroxidase [Polyangiaceae bacterium]|jgi:glutathione peroxidase
MSIYDLSARTLEGKPFSLQGLSNKVTLFVNVASFCGFTPQYTGLEALHHKFAAKGFSVVGVPSNEFGKQEPGSDEEIRDFCTTNYGVTFPLLAKAEVKAGPGQSPIYAELSRATGKVPSWNFGKYLVGRDGSVLDYFESKVAPEDARLVAAIEKALSAP